MDSDFLLCVWSFNKNGEKVYPYKGKLGPKKGLYSVNYTNDTKEFIGVTEAQLIKDIKEGKFKDRGTIRMLPLNYGKNTQRNAFRPRYYKEEVIKKL